MRVYRGPSSKPFWDDTHEFVARIKPEELEKGVRENAKIKFNITKDGTQREAVCNAVFEESDLIPLTRGLLARLTLQQEKLVKIKEIMDDEEVNDDQKVAAIRVVLASNN